jgi:hypothetical protein
MTESGRVRREKVTVRTMIGMYCHAHHEGTDSMCDNCQTLHDYAVRKIDACPFHQAKPICAKCKIHCYNKQMREQIREVMRFSGPRMMILHPTMALLHMIDRFRYRDHQV